MPLRRIFKRRRKEEKEQKRVISSAALGAEATLPTEVREGLRMAKEREMEEAIKREKRKAEKAKRIGKAIAKGGIVFVFSTIWNFIKGLFSASTAAIKAGKKAYRKP